VTLLVNAEGHLPMRSLNKKGLKRHSILETHFTEREPRTSGRFEQLLIVN
jgi:Xaa-Pro dipeptidase